MYMNRKKKMFVFFFIFTLAACGLFSSMNAYAGEGLGKLANGEGKWAQFWKPIEMFRQPCCPVQNSVLDPTNGTSR